jgi:hypothetical protein
MMIEIEQAVALLRDDNLVWSSDFEAMRKSLADLLEKASDIDFAVASLEPEIGDLAIKLLNERGN